MNRFIRVTGLVLAFSVMSLSCAYARTYETVYAEARENEKGVKNITYEQFMQIRQSGGEYVLLDVLSEKSYAGGHIEGARNFPVSEITAASAEKRLHTDDSIIVYCGSFLCSASTQAAQKLQALGYTVLDYKGGLKEWQSKGHELVSD